MYIPSTSLYISQRSAPKAAARATALVSEPPRPRTIIIDLNQVQTINDTFCYEQGDAQIKAAANVLIKTQLDNTDIMRTDGNEYLIYMVGYQEKQVVSYIRKLYKEFKNLPYEHGAAIGYSMITNDIKTIEDAINESVDDMRNKKEELENS